jgi:hypothetical integral membrane protein (TIGR02206 family)
MTIFGPLHLSLLLGIVVIAAALVTLCRRHILRARAVCTVLGCLLAVNEIAWWIWRYSREGIHADNLPLQLCDAAVWFAVAACLTRAPALAEFTWFTGMAAGGMALLTPDLWAPWPQWPAIYFFLAHGGVVLAAALLAFSGVMDFRPRSVWRPFAMLLGWATLAGCVDAAFGANYMYLRAKPASASALNIMGPWPWYIVSGAAAGLVMFWLLWLPVRPGRQGFRAPASARAGL